jgi:type IV pilus assembly protein PilM
MIAVDLGNRTTKAVHLRRTNGKLALCGYSIEDSPEVGNTSSDKTLAGLLKRVTDRLKPKTRLLTLTVNANDSILRTAEAPLMSKDDFRGVLKHSARTYLQQELTGYVYDVHPLLYFSRSEPEQNEHENANKQKQRLLIAGAKKQLIDSYVQEAKEAGLVADHVVPGLVAAINAFELAEPELFLGNALALVDVGFRTSSICVLNRGDMALSRVVAIGGDRITEGLREAMNIGYAEAEGLKIGMAAEVQRELESVVAPLGRELRASIDFFEHEHDKTVSHVFVCGASARSDVVREILQKELMLECLAWNPISFLEKELAPQQEAELDHVGSQLGVAVGAALSAM